jgi:hypothetical protein
LVCRTPYWSHVMSVRIDVSDAVMLEELLPGLEQKGTLTVTVADLGSIIQQIRENERAQVTEELSESQS